jgi:spore coat polysaccharide biosynthesis predicted glycosyltransferase SpsG
MENNSCQAPQPSNNEEEDDALDEEEEEEGNSINSKGELPPIPPQEAKTTVDYIVPSENDDYHEHILNLLKIKNNPNLNKYFYESIQKIKKVLLIETDFSIQDDKTKKIEEELLPPSILINRMHLSSPAKRSYVCLLSAILPAHHSQYGNAPTNQETHPGKK